MVASFSSSVGSRGARVVFAEALTLVGGSFGVRLTQDAAKSRITQPIATRAHTIAAPLRLRQRSSIGGPLSRVYDADRSTLSRFGVKTTRGRAPASARGAGELA